MKDFSTITPGKRTFSLTSAFSHSNSTSGQCCKLGSQFTENFLGLLKAMRPPPSNSYVWSSLQSLVNNWIFHDINSRESHYGSRHSYTAQPWDHGFSGMTGYDGSLFSITPSSSILMKTQFGLARGTIRCSWWTSLACSSFTTKWRDDLISFSTSGAEDERGDSAHLQSLLPSAEAERLCHSLNCTEKDIKQKVEKEARYRGFPHQKVLLQ